jgi:hypothetical protein
MSQNLKERVLLNRRADRERRSSPRYPFTAVCDAVEPQSGAKITGRTSDLGRGGCYIDTIGPFPKGTSLVVHISRNDETLSIGARVVFDQPGMGMGLAFAESGPEQAAILDHWIAELSGEPVATIQPVAASRNRNTATEDGRGPFEAVSELVLLLVQKRVITEPEGNSLLQKLLK